MPTITLVAVPRQGATAYDGTTDTTFRQGVPTSVEDPEIVGRLTCLESLGFRFTVVDNAEPAAPAPVADPTTEQAVETPAPDPAPAQ
jgi:hypothetical protein